ncbi:hypothetical protein BCR44DRAFT_45172 [Catenaria anguillulae PL171]|uniref:Uncharacterized protein n=1 Tax=Catenaria anguillulae PL171 TaxID=765915 RepID=A0A1Y2HG77_9FUNG|nr:hypothetical protein BCR44DRAFT_45172 [Catenaria anguillulae PL171]
MSLNASDARQMSLNASNGMQRTVGLALAGMAIGIAYCTILIPPRTANVKIRFMVNVARYLAVITSLMTTFTGFHLTHLTFASALGPYRLVIPEGGWFLVSTLWFHQSFIAVMAYLLILRIKSIIPAASNHPKFVPVALAFATALISFPALMLLIAVGQTPDITQLLPNFFYQRMFKTSLAIQTTIIGTAAICTDMTILFKIGASRVNLALNDSHTRARLRRQMIIVSVNAAVTLIEVSVRTFAIFTTEVVSVDFYLKALNISVDIFTYCTIGVTVSDVLRAPTSQPAATSGSGTGSTSHGTASTTMKHTQSTGTATATNRLAKSGSQA